LAEELLKDDHSMRVGLSMCLLGAVSFGLLGCVSKLAQRKRCDPSALVVWLFGWAALIMLIRALTLTSKASITWPVVGLGVLLGICAAVAYFAFQLSIAIGNVTVGWLVMNLSAGVPAVVSIWLYSERLTALKSFAFSLALVSLLCLLQGNRLEAREVKS
jgi:drug/metabolite transporter (DMT)-like permease